MKGPAEPTRILITGTTSGFGLALLRHYYGHKGCAITCVNRRRDPQLESQFPDAKFLVANITEPSSVESLLRGLQSASPAPNIFVLNAGINRVDNDSRFEFSEFRDVMETNLWGVLTFVQAIHRMRLTDCTIVGVSSTSTIVPNAKNVGYYVSKLSLNESFRVLSRTDRANRYKVVVLGPVPTRLNRDLPEMRGVQRKIFELLSVPPDVAAARCARFIASRARVLPPPLLTTAFYYALWFVLAFAPGIYYRPYDAEPEASPRPTDARS